MNIFTKRRLCIVFAAVMILGLCACGHNKTNQDTSTTEARSITVQDMAGDTVTLDSPADEIICTWPSGTQLMITLGMSDLLVGIPEDTKEQAWAMHIATEIKDIRSSAMKKVLNHSCRSVLI